MTSDPWRLVASEHDLTDTDQDRARRFAARGDLVVIVESGWFHRGRYVTSRPAGVELDVIGGRVVATYQPDGTPVPLVA